MSRPDSNQFRLLRMPLRDHQDVVAARQRTRLIASALEVQNQDQVKIATAVSEIARNAVEYASDAVVEFSVASSPPTFTITVNDRGPGIPRVAEIFAGQYHSPTGLGKGMVGARRLMDQMDVETGEQGTTVRLVKKLEPGCIINAATAQKVSDLLMKNTVADPLAELGLQNRDLTQALEEVQKKRAELEARSRELEQMSMELAETNRGVLALYDELDSLHRLGRVIAAQLDLGSLIRAIIDATTEISGAEFGAFFLRSSNNEQGLECHTAAGPLQDLRERFQKATWGEIFGTFEFADGVFRIDDLESEAPPGLIARGLSLRSYLGIPILDAGGTLRAAMIFGHRATNRFSERNERILGAVAAQAAVGMENAHLFTSVQAANAAKDQFLAALSHELRTPLNPIFMLLSELRRDTRLPESVRRDLDTIQRNLDLEAQLIDDLLDVTRIVRGKMNLRTEVNDVHELLLRTSATCESNSAQKNLNIRFALGAAKHHVAGDPTRLQQVFWNLLNNAIKFTPGGGSILIETKAGAEDGEICVEFTDTGRGISPALIERIFRPFEQGDDPAMAEFGGLGLGLTIAQAVVQAHGGRIAARSAGMGHGATFSVVLPTTGMNATTGASSGAPAGATEEPKWRILLVDDHSDTLHTLHRILAARGHSVVTAREAASAIAIALSEPVDFLISDIGLPGKSGLELMSEVRHLPRLKGIALSGYGSQSDIEQSSAAGFRGHLTKPIDIEELFSLMKVAAGEG